MKVDTRVAPTDLAVDRVQTGDHEGRPYDLAVERVQTGDREGRADDLVPKAGTALEGAPRQLAH